jgi:predicted transcriptional regulator of viral defense system
MVAGLNKLNNFLKKNLVVSAQEAGAMLNSQRQVYRLAERGEIQRIGPLGSGYYSLPQIEEGDAMFIVLSRYYPECVVSGETCLSLYQLGQAYIQKIDVDIPNTTDLKNSLLKVHRIHPRKIFNIEMRKFESLPVPIKIYTPERALYEAYKYSDQSEIYFRAIKKYRSHYLDKLHPGNQYDKISKIDKKLKSRILRDMIMEDTHE